MANGKRGRAPKPTALLKLNGTYRSDRHGTGHPEPKGQPTRPAHLSDLSLQFWDAVVPELVELGVATSVDQKQLEAMADWWADYELARREVPETEAGLSDLADAVRRLADAAWAMGGDDGSLVIDSVARDVGSLLDGHAKRQRERTARKQLAWAEFTRISAKFGMTPADRRSLEGTKAKTGNPFEAFLASRKKLSEKVVG